MKKIVFFVFTIIAGAALYLQRQHIKLPTFTPNTQSAETVKHEPKKDQTQYVFAATKDGQTAFELLTANVQHIQTKDYGVAGILVTGINDVQADDSHYWAFYVNDKYAKQGVSQTVLNKGDKIKFVYEKITEAKF